MASVVTFILMNYFLTNFSKNITEISAVEKGDIPIYLNPRCRYDGFRISLKCKSLELFFAQLFHMADLIELVCDKKFEFSVT